MNFKKIVKTINNFGEGHIPSFLSIIDRKIPFIRITLEHDKSKFINIPDDFLHGYGSYSEDCIDIGLNSENLYRLCPNT